ncbi:hypothetical protein FACS1894105_01610 [Clostridia bacterium]|nr:hypothetical protein FACS1894105_01380 [Clostridia bacterium]GHU34578.1 hypothetical protein FACS1894105_01610 [Clostridia bacterium]
MDKFDSILHYRMAMSVFTKWRDNGNITSAELAMVETIMAEKYGLSLCSIYRDLGKYYQEQA